MSVLADNSLDYGSVLCLEFRVKVTPALHKRDI